MRSVLARARLTTAMDGDIRAILRGAFRDGSAAPAEIGRSSCAAFTHRSDVASAAAAVALEVEAAWSDVCGMHSTKHVSIVVWTEKGDRTLVPQFHV